MTNKNQIASACIGECMQHQHKLRDANRQWFRIFRPRTRIQMKISTHFNQTHTHTQIVETNALNARIRDTEIEKRTDEERCGGDWMGRAQLESVRQFRFRLLNTDRDGTIIQVVVVHKIESTANFSFFFPAQQQFMHSMMSHCLPHNSAETRFLSLAVHANRLTLSWTRISTPTEIHATQQARKKIIEQYIYISLLLLLHK